LQRRILKEFFVRVKQNSSTLQGKDIFTNNLINNPNFKLQKYHSLSIFCLSLTRPLLLFMRLSFLLTRDSKPVQLHGPSALPPLATAVRPGLCSISPRYLPLLFSLIVLLFLLLNVLLLTCYWFLKFWLCCCYWFIVLLIFYCWMFLYIAVLTVMGVIVNRSPYKCDSVGIQGIS
jgi:hypothetical protein